MQRTLQRLIANARLPLALFALCGVVQAQQTWWVDDDGPHDPRPGESDPNVPGWSDPDEDGSPEHPFDDLYKAVEASSNGDTVLVLPSNYFGFYYLDFTLDLDGKAITVKSTDGPLVTALSGIAIPGVTGVSCNSGEGLDTVFEGFTIQDFDRGSASGTGGGGMRIEGANPTIRGCRFVANNGHLGGGLYMKSSSARIEECLFLSNTAHHQGAGIYGEGGSPDVVRCVFDLNQAPYGGGALFRTDPVDRIEISDCLFTANEASTWYGGALAKFDQGRIDVGRSTFLGNVAAGVGSAVQAHGPARIHDCFFNSNSAPTGTVNSDAGGVGPVGTTEVTGSTFVFNWGGAVTETNGSLVLSNSIAWNNSPFEIGAGAAASYCDVLGSWPGTGNIDADPMFRNLYGKDGVPGTLDDDPSILNGSPCIDAADTSALQCAPYPTDIGGNSRAVDHPGKADTGVAALGLSTDMGAHEYQPPLCPAARP